MLKIQFCHHWNELHFKNFQKHKRNSVKKIHMLYSNLRVCGSSKYATNSVLSHIYVSVLQNLYYAHYVYMLCSYP